MKILFIISHLTSGGAEKILVELANYFSKENEVYIITFSKNDSFYDIEKNVKYIKLNVVKQSYSLKNKIFNNINRILTLRKIIKDIKPDVIISFLTQTNIVSILSTTGLKIPIIISERSIFNSENNNKFWRILRRITYPFSDFLVVLTKDDSKNYSFVKNIEVIPNFLNINETPNLEKKENIILAVGRLHPVKQFDLLIKLFSKLDTNYKLYIIGEGDERKKLGNLIKKLKLENKVFLKGQQKDIYKYYKRAKILVLTSKYEAFPNVLLEAMYFGCAIVSFNCDYGPRAIIENNKNGFLVDNEEEFIKKLNLLIRNDNLRKKIAKNAILRAKDFEFSKIIKKWEELFDNSKIKKNFEK